MTGDIAPDVLADAIRRRLAASGYDVNAYWMRVAQDRDAYARALEQELQAEPVAVIIVRDARFTNPNALLSDFVALIADNKTLCLQRFTNECIRCGVVLLSR